MPIKGSYFCTALPNNKTQVFGKVVEEILKLYEVICCVSEWISISRKSTGSNDILIEGSSRTSVLRALNTSILSALLTILHQGFYSDFPHHLSDKVQKRDWDNL